MNPLSPVFKNIGLWLLVVGVGLVLTALLFFSSISIYIGFKHSSSKGFWMPIVVGVLIFIGSSWLFGNLLKFFIRELRSRKISLD